MLQIQYSAVVLKKGCLSDRAIHIYCCQLIVGWHDSWGWARWCVGVPSVLFSSVRSSLRYDAALYIWRHHPFFFFNFHSAQCHSVTTVSLNRTNKGSSHNMIECTHAQAVLVCLFFSSLQDFPTDKKDNFYWFPTCAIHCQFEKQPAAPIVVALLRNLRLASH